MIKTLVLDTNALISLFKDADSPVRRYLMKAGRLVIPLMSYGEFMVGVENQQNVQKPELKLLDELLQTPNTEVHLPDKETARIYARIYNQLRKQGTPIPTSDIWVAAETMEVKGTLYSADGHFENVPLLDWIDGR